MSEHSVPAPLEQQLFVDRAITCNKMLLNAMTDAVDPIQDFIATQNATGHPDNLMIDALVRSREMDRSMHIGFPALQQPLPLDAEQECPIDSVFWKHPTTASIGSLVIVTELLSSTNARLTSNNATGNGNEFIRTEVYHGSYGFKPVSLTFLTYRNPSYLNSEQIIFMRAITNSRPARLASKLIDWANRSRT